MPFINNQRFSEIRKAATEGNEKALMILQAMRKNGSQDDLDRLVNDYYGVGNEPTIEELEKQVVEEQPVEQEPVQTDVEEAEIGVEPVVAEVEDISEILNNETDGLFDENDVETIGFSDFLSNKKRDGLRARKNADYFKAFNSDGVSKYLADKKEKYKNKFGDSLHDIDRMYNDYDKSIDIYSRGVNDLLDDQVEIDTQIATSAYDDITSNNGIMHSFGRHWDEEDTNHVLEDLKLLVAKYGKKNVLAALNTLKADNTNYKDFKINQINQEVERYNKSLDKILK